MTNEDFLTARSQHVVALESRLTRLQSSLNDEQWNQPLPPSNWTAGQIIRHMILANQPYLGVLAGAVAAAPPSTGGDVRLTWFGKVLSKNAGPAGSVPAPKSTIPESGPMDRAVFTALLEQLAEVRKLIDSAASRELATRFSNPYVPIFRMSLADAFQVIADHTERHVGQIENGHDLKVGGVT